MLHYVAHLGTYGGHEETGIKPKSGDVDIEYPGTTKGAAAFKKTI